MFSGLKKWRHRRTLRRLERESDEFASNMLKIADGIEKAGFVVTTERQQRVDHFWCDVHHTVGLWLLMMPELVTFGPFGADQKTLTKILSAYLREVKFPQDGDLVVIEGRRFDIRRADDDAVGRFVTTALFLGSAMGRTSMPVWPELGFMQVVPESHSPPVKLWRAELNSGRTITLDEPLAPEEIRLRIAEIRRILPELVKSRRSKTDVAR